MGADVTECKTLKNAWWLQLLKRQNLRFAVVSDYESHALTS
jgi:hypothetical protein